MENNNIEIRYAEELRADNTNGMVYGKAISFNTESVLLGGKFNEVIKPSAATEDFLRGQDIIMKYNHEPNSVLARYSPTSQRNSLKWTVDETGVFFEFRAKKNDQWILESVANGDIKACSFAFRVGKDDNAEKWEKRSDGTALRTINQFDKVSDFSLVLTPAYEATYCDTRGLDELSQTEELRKAEEQRKLTEDQEAQKQKELAFKAYYKKLCKETLPNIYKI